MVQCELPNMVTLCSSRKKSIPTPWKVIGNSQGGGGGVLKVKLLEAKYETNLEFPRGREDAKQKTLCGVSIEIFWTSTLSHNVHTGNK